LSVLYASRAFFKEHYSNSEKNKHVRYKKTILHVIYLSFEGILRISPHAPVVSTDLWVNVKLF